MQLNHYLKNKRVLVTGVCGTVGSEIFQILCQTPEYELKEIVGIDNLGLLTMHFTLALKTDAEKFDSVMSRKFPENERTFIAECYAKLRDKGLWPRSIDKFGEITWGIATMSELHRKVDSMPLMPKP